MDRNYASRRYIYLAGVNYDHDVIVHDSGLIIKEWKLVFIQPYSLVTEDILAGKAHKIVAGPRPTSEGVHPGCGLVLQRNVENKCARLTNKLTQRWILC